MASQHAAPSVAPRWRGIFLRGFPMTRSTGFGLFAMIVALIAYMASPELPQLLVL
jgi:hypothetical protein